MTFPDLKLAHIDMYTRRLSEREKRKRCGQNIITCMLILVFSFARQHNLISGKQRSK